MLRKMNRINHGYFPRINGVRMLSGAEMGGRTKVSSGLYSAETIATLRPAVPKQSYIMAQRIAREEKRAMITERLWIKYGTNEG